MLISYGKNFALFPPCEKVSAHPILSANDWGNVVQVGNDPVLTSKVVQDDFRYDIIIDDVEMNLYRLILLLLPNTISFL